MFISILLKQKHLNQLFCTGHRKDCKRLEPFALLMQRNSLEKRPLIRLVSISAPPPPSHGWLPSSFLFPSRCHQFLSPVYYSFCGQSSLNITQIWPGRSHYWNSLMASHSWTKSKLLYMTLPVFLCMPLTLFLDPIPPNPHHTIH